MSRRFPLPSLLFHASIDRPRLAALHACTALTTLTAAAGLALGGCTTARADAPAVVPVADSATGTATAEHASANHTSDNDKDTAAEALLDQLEAAAAHHRTLTARVRMRSIQELLDDETARFGDLAWARADAPTRTPTRFAVSFDRLKTLDGPLEAVERHYVYDGQWLLDTDGRARTATRRELNAAPAHGPNGDAGLAFGEGPFLLPLNLKKERVLAKFSVALAAPDARVDPADAVTDHLVLTPRATTQMDAVRLDLWFDRDTRLPHRVASEQADGDRTVIDLFEVAVNPPLPAGHFATPLPDTPGWELQTVPLATP